MEACGILIGEANNGTKNVVKINPAGNIMHSIAGYQIDPQDLYRSFNEAETYSLQVLGFYHSHPYWSAFPSDIDTQNATYPSASYLIYSVPHREARSFLWDGRRFTREEIQLVQ